MIDFDKPCGICGKPNDHLHQRWNEHTQRNEVIVAPVSKNDDGWCGESCPGCGGTGEVDTEHSYGPCGRCGGTGERYESHLDKRDPDAA